MAKTLVIKSANYSENALDRVVFNTIPCTGISLDKAQDTIASIGGTSIIVATVTPSDATESIVWSSSDETVATVTNGFDLFQWKRFRIYLCNNIERVWSHRICKRHFVFVWII